ncbi:lycopene cyclase family protein [Winogradskyella aquimaris]|uniref:Lycopene cyclase family protein n=1 Tax=Winogradskyella aquimaris TaxID=864074 RepID=A0ABU5EL49_9FLAO|nr:lycopene cyclase family protein [Winogradskyella aquimaris]MDY2587140.1 lycopene cyclase family protein [Winogradskyella aquimaris]
MANYDYIILGAGASGLMLAYRMASDAFFDDKSVLIIDKEKQKGNDRTWCFWENSEGEWDDILTKTWSKIYFGSKDYDEAIDILPYQYKMIRSEHFYHKLWQSIDENHNIKFLNDEVVNFTESKDNVQVITKNGNYTASKLFNSIHKANLYNSQKKYPVLQQHFVGWFVKTKEDFFDDSVATFMDFTVPQNGNTRFMYVLPTDKKTALVEYTLFSKDLLQLNEYEAAITDYLAKKNIYDFEIVEKEKGSIPMTVFEFSKFNSKHILNIGTAGGWTKASTGYTFINTTKKTKALITFLKSERDLSKFHKQSKFWYYDLIFLDVLANHNKEGAALFTSMFKKANIKTIFKFLDEESNLLEDLKIILSVPSKRFIQSLLKRLF